MSSRFPARGTSTRPGPGSESRPAPSPLLCYDGRVTSAPDAERDWIFHVDLDQFLAAVEVLRRPELAGRPVVVGGDGNPGRARQVVATASYEARVFGVRSGMPLQAAARRCPDAVFLPSDRPAYDAASARVMATLRSFPAVVEVWGWDEAYLLLDESDGTADPMALAHRIRTVIDYDKVLVMDGGTVAEYDTPLNLLQKQGGLFKSMCEQTGEYGVLLELALDSES